MKKYAILVAGGLGKRMRSPVPKQFLMLGNKPVLYYSLKAFIDAFPDLQVILVLPEDYTAMGQEIIDAWFDKERIQITEGGDTRFQSVKNGLALIQDESMILVHDAVRCLVSVELIQRCYQKAVETGSAIPVVPCKDSVRLITDEGNEALDRDKIVLVQTPQAFHSRILMPAFNIDFKDRFTDEASVVEAYGLKVSLVEGEESNIKITHEADLLVAEKLVDKRN